VAAVGAAGEKSEDLNGKQWMIGENLGNFFWKLGDLKRNWMKLDDLNF